MQTMAQPEGWILYEPPADEQKGFRITTVLPRPFEATDRPVKADMVSGAVRRVQRRRRTAEGDAGACPAGAQTQPLYFDLQKAERFGFPPGCFVNGRRADNPTAEQRRAADLVQAIDHTIRTRAVAMYKLALPNKAAMDALTAWQVRGLATRCRLLRRDARR